MPATSRARISNEGSGPASSVSRAETPGASNALDATLERLWRVAPAAGDRVAEITEARRRRRQRQRVAPRRRVMPRCDPQED